MGEIADMMINGLMCQYCGEFMEDHEEPGYPRSCGGCEDYNDRNPKIVRSKRKRKRARK